MSSQNAEESTSEKRSKPRRAEREIYRPGALRQMKESVQSQSSVPSAHKSINSSSKKVNNPSKNILNKSIVFENSKSLTKPKESQTYVEEIKSSKEKNKFHKTSENKSKNLETKGENISDNYNFVQKYKAEPNNVAADKAKINEFHDEHYLSCKLSEDAKDPEVKSIYKSDYKRAKKNYNEIEIYKPKPRISNERSKVNKPLKVDGVPKLADVVSKEKDYIPAKDFEKLKLDSSNIRKNEKYVKRDKEKYDSKKLNSSPYVYDEESFAYSKPRESKRNNNKYDGSSKMTNYGDDRSAKKCYIPDKFSDDYDSILNSSKNKIKHKEYKKPNNSRKPDEIKPKSQDESSEVTVNTQIMKTVGELKKYKTIEKDDKKEFNNDNPKVNTAELSNKASGASSDNVKILNKEDVKLSEETESDIEFNIINKPDHRTINSEVYMDYRENSFYENPNKTRGHDKTLHPKSKSPTPSNISWADEKWSPAQRQRKKRGKSYTKEFSRFESPGRRGIIQINSMPSSNLEPPTETAASTGQRLLFNPNNPSKPVAVMPSARDLPPSWEQNSGSYDKNNEESHSGVGVGSELIPDNETGCGLDPSIFYSIQKGELDINYFVNSNQLPQEFRRIMDIRIHLQSCYKQLLISDIRLCQEKNIEGALWKSLYYIIIEKLREYINREPTLKERSLSTMMMIVEEGLVYLQSLLTAIQAAYHFSLEAHFEEDLTSLPGTKNRVKHALYSCQKILLSLGDLARYREQYSMSPNYLQAKKWYEMALQVNPKNGRPFNQLAIIAVSQKRSLDVVYYYIRSLTASNPFTSARDSLISMFDDIRKKYETLSSSKQTTGFDSKDQDKRQEAEDSRRKDGSLRQEIWIRPDSGATNKRTLSQSDPEEEKRSYIEELQRIPHDQLMKQFLTSYLHCHGMLFSKVGLDHFNKVLGETLNLFQALLQLSPPKLSPTHLLQIMAINMFAVDNTQLRDSRIESSYRSAAQDLALLLSQEMFSRLAEVMVKLFPSCLNYAAASKEGPTAATAPKDEEISSSGGSPPRSATTGSPPVVESQRLFQAPLKNFIPAAKVWCDWLLYQSSMWNPPPVSHDISGLDTWSVVGELATIVKGIGPPDVALTDKETVSPPGGALPTAAAAAPPSVAVTLPEDVFLRGYSPIANAQTGSFCVADRTRVNKERAQDWIRVKKFQLCLCQFLCGVEPPVLRLQKTDQGEILVAVVTTTPPDSPAVTRSSIGSCEIDLEDSNSEVEGSYSEDEADVGPPCLDVGGEETPLASTVKLLARRKKLLEKRQRQQRKMQAILEGAVTLEMEVKPRYLVPDTNCFIEKLSIIKALLEHTSYTFMVPLIVLVELDGLSKDAAVEKYGDVTHAVNVREGAATAIHYVQSNKNSRLKCVTSQGSVAPSNMFSLEMDTLKDITNDDKILSCCLHLCSDTNKRRPIKEGVRRLHREVVLLTEDRNLRVKAYARDVPVRELTDFAHWAGVK